MRWLGGARRKRVEMESLIIAYAIIAVVLGAYIGAIVVRTRRLARALREAV